MKVIENVKSNARGLDGLDLRMILLIVPHLLRHVTYIINFSLLHNSAACS